MHTNHIIVIMVTFFNTCGFVLQCKSSHKEDGKVTTMIFIKHENSIHVSRPPKPAAMLLTLDLTFLYFRLLKPVK